ncbi:iduronate 2-sulfatase [Anthonomus grandis grandis]|uniref:iduronate 2-sulfatase n=1 Tax=Anthonomus grandis grandis TaxID=2921223 RepID=UPI002165DCE3|nr:iduronate 2-sulfatase [Anthonomus grandis grandis]XP_050303882.1 iduronate 2-sulfatase [Anthonomus grandis grandis]
MKTIFLLFLCIFGARAYRPNVLFIILDDLRPALQVYGDTTSYSPNINSLAKKSFVFQQAYAQQALCAPSRNSLLTSRRPDTLHLYDFYSYWRDAVGNFTTLPQHFKEHGYQTYSIGKVFHPGISSNFSDDQPYSWTRSPYHPKTEQFKNAKVCTNSDGTLGKNLICPVVTEFQPLGTLPDIESTNEAVKFLQATKTNTQPYFLAVGFHKPHIPFKFPERYLDYHPLSNISLPSNRVRPSLLPDVAWNPWIDIRERDDVKKLNIPFPYGPIPDDLNKRIIQAYYASVTYVDDLIGKVLQNADFTNTIVVVTSDHGWSLGQHGEFSKYSNFEEATRVPLIIHVPNLSEKRINVDSLTELVDIFPTLVDLTRVSEPLLRCPKSAILNVCTEGKSLLPVMLGSLEMHKKVQGKSAIFTQHPRPGARPTLNPNSDKPHLRDIQIMGYSIKTNVYRYSEWVGFDNENFRANWTKIYGRELYNHQIDPQENLNLEDRADLQPIIKKLRKRLILGWRKSY